MSLKHTKTNSITNWTQAQLDAQIALGNFPAGTLLANITLPSDWNADHVVGTGGLNFSGTASPSYAAGNLVYDTSDECLTFFNNDSGVSLQIGQEEWAMCVNNTGSTIANGKAVYVNGSSGNRPTIALAQGNTAATSICLGITTQSIANGATGRVTTLGLVHMLDTSAFSAGAVYLSAATPGALTQTAPSAPNLVYRLGFVVSVDAALGIIQVTPSKSDIGLGTANQVRGINNAGTASEYKTITAGTNIGVVHGANTITINNTGTGDFVGPASSTDNAVVRFDATTGKLGQNSGVIIDDSNNITGVGTIAMGNASISGTTTITSASATSLTVGRLGATTPAFQVDSSTATQVAGVSITGAVTGGTPVITAIDSGSNTNLTVTSKGTGVMTIGNTGGGSVTVEAAAANSLIFRTNFSQRMSLGQSNVNFTPTVSSSTAATKRFSFTGAADLALTGGAEAISVQWDLAQTRQHASNTAITTQRDFIVLGSNHTFASSGGTITNQAALTIQPSAASNTNATCTNNNTVFIPSVALLGTHTNSYGLNVTAHTGATNNYAAIINGVVAFPSGAANANKVEGDRWHDSTQKCPTYYSAGVIQYGSTSLFTQTATKTIANSSAETTLFTTGIGTLTLPANFFVIGKTISVNLGGVFSTLAVTPGNVTVNVKLGSVTIATATVTNILSSASNNAFMGFIDITCRTTGASGTIMCNGNFNYDTGVLARGFAALNNAGATSTIDTTASNAIDITFTWATANASNSVSCTTGRVEVLS